MDELLSQAQSLQKITRKIDVLKTLLTEEEPNYELKIISSYEEISVDLDISIDTINKMVKKYSKIRKNLLTEFKKEVKTLK